jgi:hypothetical protein
MTYEIIAIAMSDRKKAVRLSDMRRLWMRPDVKSTESNDAIHDADDSERL